MMVDDDPVLVEAIQSTLEEVGYANFTATTEPAGAMQLMKRFRPDLLLLDVVMPQIDGLTLLEMIAADGDLKRTPVIVLTHHLSRGAVITVSAPLARRPTVSSPLARRTYNGLITSRAAPL